MAEYHFPIPGSIDEDKIILFVRRHWASYLGPFFLSLMILIFPLILILIFEISDFSVYQGILRNFIVLGLSIYYLVGIMFAYISWVTYYYDIYIITSESIVDVVQEGIWGRKISQLSLLRVQDVNSSIQGFLPTIFGYGDVLVETAGEQSQNFLLKSLPNPQEVASKIMQLHNQMIEVEGRHHEMLEAEGVLAPGKISQDEAKQEVSQSNQVINEDGQTLICKPVDNRPSYQELLEKERKAQGGQERPVQEARSSEEQSSNFAKNDEGEISHNDLDQGGQIDLKS
jgi:membrane protein YdbS with pleckstrin-like domain